MGAESGEGKREGRGKEESEVGWPYLMPMPTKNTMRATGAMNLFHGRHRLHDMPTKGGGGERRGDIEVGRGRGMWDRRQRQDK
jgi:hypothetical protein